ncbi:M56 family metallopeptidase [bacterium D16-51]|nr:M56 family metallopeptidase [bacterium D16-59]RKI56706.1 M56 family metallopeptidase [bacterium D16-51]
MYFTIFSLIVAVFWVSVFAKLISVLRKQMAVLKYFSVSPLIIMLLFCILRIVLPIELPYTYVFEIKRILPQIQSFFAISIFSYGQIKITIAVLLGIIWFIVATILAVRNIWSYCHFRKFLNFLPASDDERLYHLLAETGVDSPQKVRKIIVHDAVQSPAIVGAIHPIIILPNIDFDDEELLGIFIHEIAHYKYKHHFVRLLTEFVHICFWWNPLFKDLSSEMEHALEMHSDKMVSRKLTYSQQKKYLSTIIRILEDTENSGLPSGFSCGLVDEPNNEKLQQRFKMILGKHYQEKKKFNFAAIVCIVFIFLLSYSFVLQPYSEPTASDYGYEDEEDIFFSASDYYIIETEDGYDLYKYPQNLVGHMEDIGSEFKSLKVYQSLEEVKKE